jgi:chromosome segregation ATPase
VSAIIRACAILVRAFDSGSGHAGLGITPDDAREASVAARTEHDANAAALRECRAELASVQEVCSRQLDVLIERTEALESARAELAVIRQHRDTLQDAWEQAVTERDEARALLSQSGDQIAPVAAEPAENKPDSR